jgi:hypothetical protein
LNKNHWIINWSLASKGDDNIINCNMQDHF